MASKPFMPLLSRLVRTGLPSARGDEASLPRCDADHRGDSPEVPAAQGFISLTAKEMPGDDVAKVLAMLGPIKFGRAASREKTHQAMRIK